MARPYRRAWHRAYYGRWLRRAWSLTIEFERTWGLVANLVLAALTALTYRAIRGPSAGIGALILAALEGAVLFLILAFVVALALAPARLAFESEEDDPNTEMLQMMSIPKVEGGPDRLEFVTRNMGERLLSLSDWGKGRRLDVIRIVGPVHQTIRRGDLPAEVSFRLGRGGLVVKAFDAARLVVEERHTSGRMVVVELFFHPEP